MQAVIVFGLRDAARCFSHHAAWNLNARVSDTVWKDAGCCVSTRSMTGVRIDKWLWAARFFKTRALAARACELGRIQSNHQPAKPAREVHVSDLLQIRTEGGEFQVEVLLLSEVRGPAPIAQTLYRETEASRDLRLKAAEERKAMRSFAPAPAGRPSKRDRRRIIQFRSQRDNA